MYLIQNILYFAVCSGTDGIPASPNDGCNAANPTCNAEETGCRCNDEVCDAATKFCNDHDDTNSANHACETCSGDDTGSSGNSTTQGNCPAGLVCDATGGCSGMKWEELKYIR